MSEIKKRFIWTDERMADGWGWLLPHEPEEMIYTEDFLEIDIKPEDVEAIEQEYSQNKFRIFDFLDEKEINYKHMEEYTKPEENVVVFDLNCDTFGLLEDIEERDVVIPYWNGHNYVNEYLGENENQIEVETIGDSICLDKWDGNNMTTGGNFEHAYVYHTTNENLFLVVETSQWVGSKDKACIMTKSELLNYLKLIDREDFIKEL